LTGNRHNARILPTGSLEFILALLNSAALSAFVVELPAPEPIERLGWNLEVGCVAVNGQSLSPLLRSELPFHVPTGVARLLLCMSLASVCQ